MELLITQKIVFFLEIKHSTGVWVLTQKKHFFLPKLTLNFLLFCVFQLFSTINAESDYFNQCLGCAAPKCWSKYTAQEVKKFCLVLEVVDDSGWSVYQVKLDWEAGLLQDDVPLPHLRGLQTQKSYLSLAPKWSFFIYFVQKCFVDISWLNFLIKIFVFFCFCAGEVFFKTFVRCRTTNDWHELGTGHICLPCFFFFFFFC